MKYKENLYCPCCKKMAVQDQSMSVLPGEVITCQHCGFTNVILAFSIRPIKEKEVAAK